MRTNGVSYYTHKQITIDLPFPEDDVCCVNCKMCIRDPSNTRRVMCFATGELILYDNFKGLLCPIEEKENETV